MAAHQVPPSLGFSRQKHWSGLPFPSPMHESEKRKWSHSVMSDLSDPMAYSLPGSSIQGMSLLLNMLSRLDITFLPMSKHLLISCLHVGDPEEGNGNPLQYSCLENSRGAWWATVHQVAKIQTSKERISIPFSRDIPDPMIKHRFPALQMYSLLPEPP